MAGSLARTLTGEDIAFGEIPVDIVQRSFHGFDFLN
jgi:hypothetical protein